MALPPVKTDLYNKSKAGFFGELGRGANAEIKFLQSAISRDELDTITLIENIPGSEKWDVRDLFQRDVDKDRVTSEILPYFKDPSRVKFFNPLTLAILPLEEGGEHIIRDLAVVSKKKEVDDDHPYDVLEVEPFFQFRVHQKNPAFSTLKWNDRRVKIVAIDGQHRLSALKRWKNETGASSKELASWKIPVVVLGIFKAVGNKPAATVLEIVRKTFVYINSKAEEVNEARKILLNDESVNSLCVQELVQTAHSNDSKAVEVRDKARVPLLFFDWRGEVRNHVRQPGPAALKKLEEVYLWFENYLLGEDGCDYQEEALALEDLVPPLETFGEDRTLSHEDAKKVRDQFRKTLLPGLLHLIENFTPYKTYITECRKIEAEALKESDLSEHAFMKLRFGTSRASEDMLDDVQEKYRQLVDRFTKQKDQSLEELVRLDIGMRGVVSAFAEAKRHFDSFRGGTASWLEFSEWFTKAINIVHGEGWFKSFSDQAGDKKRILTHVTYDDVGSIVNYRPGDVPAAFGTVLLLLVFSRGRDITKEQLADVWSDCSSSLMAPLRKGLRKHFRSQLQDSFQGTPAEFKAEVNHRAEQAVEKRLKKLEAYLELS